MSNQNTYIIGSKGGGKGGGGGSVHVPVEAANTLKSKSYVKIVEVLCEGEIEGLVNGAQSIFLDKTPLQNSDGTYNFSDVVVEERRGTLDQTITKIGTETSATTSLGTEVKFATPITHTITAADVDKARVAIRVPALTSQDTSTGDMNGTSVSLKVEYMPNGGGWIQPPIGYSTKSLNPNNFTGVTTISGSSSVSHPYKKVYNSDYERDRWDYVYYPITVTHQYSKDGGVWTTFQTTVSGQGGGGGGGDVTFSLNTVITSSYAIRVLVSGAPAGTTGGSASVTFLNGSYPSSEFTISGKTTSPYERDVEFDLTGSAPWIIRVTRLTADSTSSALQNKTYLSSVTQIFTEKFRYPATAYIALSIDAQQFNNIPERAYDVKLLKIKVPTNYDPLARTYTGIWDGTFKTAWSDNPAWCFYDLLTNKRYGLGERIDATQINKWQLYDIAQYCDELLDAGDGTMQPRYTCNLLIQTREEAYKVLQDMASIFAGLTYWGSSADGFQGVIPVADKPQSTYSYVYNNSNVIDGVFTRQSANINTRYNAVYVTYNDPDNNYEQAVVYVPDNTAIAQDGFVNDTNIVAFGCVSRAQATRLGRRVLYTNRYENEVISFSVGADGVIPQISSIVKVSDSLHAGDRMGGRILSYIDSTHLKLDMSFNFNINTQYSICVIGFDGKYYESVVVNPGTTTDTITLVTALPQSIAKNSAFILSSTTLESELFRVVSVSETEQHTYMVSAVQHNPGKYDYIDRLVELPNRDTTVSDMGDPVTNLTSTEVLYQDGINIKSKLVISWTPARFSSSFIVKYVSSDNNISTAVTTNPTYEILDTTPSTYTVSVTSIDVLGGKSSPVSADITVYGKLLPPADVTGLTVSAFSNAANITWNAHPDLDVRFGGYIEIRHTPKTTGYKWEDGMPIATVNGSNTSVIASLLAGTYMAKAVDSSGVYSLNAAFADSSFAQIDNLNVVATVQEQTAWAGVKTNTIKNGNVLTLISTGTIDGVTKQWDELQSVDFLDFNVASTGTYEFANKVDLGGVLTSRVTALLDYYAYDIADTIDARSTNIDEWASFDGNVVDKSFVKLYVATTENDPNGVSPTWSAWKEFIVADYKARGYKFKLEFTNPVPTNTINVLRAEVTVDMPDRVVGEDDISAPNTGYTVTYPAPFFAKPSVAIRIDDMQQGDYYEISSNTASGFTILFRNSSGTAVARQFDYISKGYGYVHI